MAGRPRRAGAAARALVVKTLAAVPDMYEVMTGELERRRRFNELFAAFGSDIVAYCNWRAESESDAQDAVADVFLTAWRRLDKVPAGDAARIWLYATARRVIANQRRSNRRSAALRERLTVEASLEQRRGTGSPQDEMLVHEALRRLGPRDREVLLLAEWEGLSVTEIAGVLGCLAVTARGRLHRARRRFRAVYEALPERDELSVLRYVSEGGS